MKRTLLLFSFLLFLLPGFSQTQDLGSWNTFSFDKGIGKRFAFNFDEELRLKNNISNLNLVYTNLGFTVKAADFLKISVVYRFIDKVKDDGYYGIRNRFYTDFVFKEKRNNWSFSYRARFQGEWRTAGYHSELDGLPEYFLRNLFKVSYKMNDKFSPYLGTELRWQLKSPFTTDPNGFDRTRFYAGCDYKINDKLSAGAYFLEQREWRVSDPETMHIIGLEFGVSID